MDGIGDLKRVNGADQDFETGAISEVAAQAPEGAGLFSPGIWWVGSRVN